MIARIIAVAAVAVSTALMAPALVADSHIDLNFKLQACAALEPDDKRLECYDRIARQHDEREWLKDQFELPRGSLRKGRAAPRLGGYQFKRHGVPKCVRHHRSGRNVGYPDSVAERAQQIESQERAARRNSVGAEFYRCLCRGRRHLLRRGVGMGACGILRHALGGGCGRYPKIQMTNEKLRLKMARIAIDDAVFSHT